jgi:hypothetical protein
MQQLTDSPRFWQKAGGASGPQVQILQQVFHSGSGIGLCFTCRNPSANSVTLMGWFTAMSRKTWVVPLVGQWISRSATRPALARPMCCSSGLAPERAERTGDPERAGLSLC